MTYHITIDDAGRLVIPKPLRERYGLSGGTRLQVIAEQGGLLLSVDRAEPRLMERDGFLVLEAGEMYERDVDHRDEREGRIGLLTRYAARR